MKRAVCLSLMILFLAVGNAAAGRVATGIKVGSLGIGADVTVGLHERLNFRLNGNYLALSFSSEIEDIDYDLDVDFKTAIAMLDWHPFASGFRITGGVSFNDKNFTLSGTPTQAERIGDRIYPPELVGTINGDVEPSSIAPYLGIGYGRAVGHEGRLSFVFDLGLLYQTYDVSLTATGPAFLLPEFRDDLAKEEGAIQSNFDDFRIYPILAFGISYQF